MREYDAHGNTVRFKNEAATFHTLNTESEALKDLLNEMQDGDVFVDIGACGGEYSIITECSPYDVEVISFEPSSENIDVFWDMLRLNDASVQIIPKAVSNYDGVASFNNHDVPALKSLDDDGRQSVEVCKLDTLKESGAIPCPDIIKLDAEGEELNALRGMEDTLRFGKPRLMYVELHTFGYDYNDVYNLLRGHGFTITKMDERDPDLNHENWLIKAER